MKYSVQAGVVSPFLMALDPAAVDFDADQSAAIDAVQAEGGVALWDGARLAFETDGAKAADLLMKFSEAWKSSKIFAVLQKQSDAEQVKIAEAFSELLKTASGKPKLRKVP